MKETAAIIVSAIVCAGALAAPANDAMPCAEQICLGMTIDELAKFSLVPARLGRLSFGGNRGLALGLDIRGQPIWFSVSELDRSAIVQLQNKVKVICSASPIFASTRTSDGLIVHMTLRPQLIAGRGQLVVSEIQRTLPATVNTAERKAYEDQAREKYGDRYISVGRGLPDKPSAKIESDFDGVSLNLSMPLHFYDANRQLMDQPGCSETPRLD